MATKAPPFPIEDILERIARPPENPGAETHEGDWPHALLARREHDINRLVAAVRDMAAAQAEANLGCIGALREDLDRRERLVAEREARVWGWRLIASARDGEMEAELEALREREVQVAQKERRLMEKEQQLLAREAMLEHSTQLIEEEQAAQASLLREEIARARSRFGLSADGGLSVSRIERGPDAPSPAGDHCAHLRQVDDGREPSL